MITLQLKLIGVISQWETSPNKTLQSFWHYWQDIWQDVWIRYLITDYQYFTCIDSELKFERAFKLNQFGTAAFESLLANVELNQYM